jgi:hypothetical protein
LKKEGKVIADDIAHHCTVFVAFYAADKCCGIVLQPIYPTKI